MTLTKDAQKQFDFSIECYRNGLTTAWELKKALDSIYTEDLNRQSDFLIGQGFSASGAFNHIHSVDTGVQIL